MINLSFNSDSKTFIDKVYKFLKNNPMFEHYNVDQQFNQYDTRIELRLNGMPVTMFLFSPNPKGYIHSVAIYGSSLQKHYDTIKKSMNIFGLRVTNIEVVMENTASPFVDVHVNHN